MIPLATNQPLDVDAGPHPHSTNDHSGKPPERDLSCAAHEPSRGSRLLSHFASALDPGKDTSPADSPPSHLATSPSSDCSSSASSRRVDFSDRPNAPPQTQSPDNAHSYMQRGDLDASASAQSPNSQRCELGAKPFADKDGAASDEHSPAERVLSTGLASTPDANLANSAPLPFGSEPEPSSPLVVHSQISQSTHSSPLMHALRASDATLPDPTPGSAPHSTTAHASHLAWPAAAGSACATPLQTSPGRDAGQFHAVQPQASALQASDAQAAHRIPPVKVSIAAVATRVEHDAAVQTPELGGELGAGPASPGSAPLPEPQSGMYPDAAAQESNTAPLQRGPRFPPSEIDIWDTAGDASPAATTAAHPSADGLQAVDGPQPTAAVPMNAPVATAVPVGAAYDEQSVAEARPQAECTVRSAAGTEAVSEASAAGSGGAAASEVMESGAQVADGLFHARTIVYELLTVAVPHQIAAPETSKQAVRVPVANSPRAILSRLLHRLGPSELPPQAAAEQAHLEALAATALNPANTLHSRALSCLYQLCTGRPLTALQGPHWSPLGFQGVDPATDLRGSGLLALVNMLQLFLHNSDNAQRMFVLSQQPEHEFPFALVSINITKWCLDAIQLGKLNAAATKTSMLEAASRFYIGAFYRFCAAWIQEGGTLLTIAIHLKAQERFARRNVAAVLASSCKILEF